MSPMNNKNPEGFPEEFVQIDLETGELIPEDRPAGPPREPIRSKIFKHFGLRFFRGKTGYALKHLHFTFLDTFYLGSEFAVFFYLLVKYLFLFIEALMLFVKSFFSCDRAAFKP